MIFLYFYFPMIPWYICIIGSWIAVLKSFLKIQCQRTGTGSWIALQVPKNLVAKAYWAYNGYRCHPGDSQRRPWQNAWTWESGGAAAAPPTYWTGRTLLRSSWPQVRSLILFYPSFTYKAFSHIEYIIFCHIHKYWFHTAQIYTISPTTLRHSPPCCDHECNESEWHGIKWNATEWNVLYCM